MLSRRTFLKSSSLISLSPWVTNIFDRTAHAAAAQPDANILVVIQLDGGNDGINTVVPFGDDGYGRNRDALRLKAGDLHKLNDHVGLHPQMKPAKELFDENRLTIVQGVGYPNPDRSHFRSMRIWQTARFDDEEHDSYGWLGRALDEPSTESSREQPGAVYVGTDDVPVALWGRRSESMSVSRLEDLKLPFPQQQLLPSDANIAVGATQDNALNLFVTRQMLSAYAAADRFQQQRSADGASTAKYPATELGTQLKLLSDLIKSGSRARVFYTSQGGYDTHAAQSYTHSRLLNELSGALKAFLDDMKQSRLEDRIVVLAFSEFGRRVKENASQGTDHGAAGPVFLAGSKTAGGLIGPASDLANLEDGDIRMATDFRAIYTAILEDWLQVDAASVLGGQFDKVQVIRA